MEIPKLLMPPLFAECDVQELEYDSPVSTLLTQVGGEDPVRTILTEPAFLRNYLLVRRTVQLVLQDALRIYVDKQFKIFYRAVHYNTPNIPHYVAASAHASKKWRNKFFGSIVPERPSLVFLCHNIALMQSMEDRVSAVLFSYNPVGAWRMMGWGLVDAQAFQPSVEDWHKICLTTKTKEPT